MTLRSRVQPAAPRLAALCTLYEGERFLSAWLDDMAASTIAAATELVIVDAASSGRETEIVAERIAAGMPNITYLRTDTHETTGVGLNRAVGLATAPYLTVANVDDRHRPDALEILCDELDHRPDVSLVYADCAVTECENEDPVTSLRVVDYLSWPAFDRRLLFSWCFIGPQPLYRASLHERYGPYDESLQVVNDYDFYLRCVRAGERFHHVADVLGLYLRSPRGVEYRNPRVTLDETELVRRRHWPTEEWGPYGG